MKYLFSVLFCFCSFSVFAQHHFRFEQKNDIKVVVGTDTLRQPWIGGFNSPVFSTIKLNNDATEDLYVFDRNSKKSFTFLADNASGTWQWKYAPEYETYFPETMEFWTLLRDFDNDGDKDLFTGNQLRTLLYENRPLPGKPLNFIAPRNLKFDLASNMPLGPYVLPALTDVDNDGDMDILAFDEDRGNTIYYYKNRSVELGYLDDSLKLTRDRLRWGQFDRCNATCNTFKFGAMAVLCRAAAPMHFGGASILALDLDGDVDKDIIVGADMCPDLVRLTNKGTTALARMDSTSLSLTYPLGTTPASIINFPAAYYEDVNFDGKKDLLVSPFLADNLDKANFTSSVWFYQNNAASASAAPVFAFHKNNFLQDQMIDVGLEAFPAFADIDADGDLDMLVGNFADYRSGTTQYRSSVSLYTNVGTAAKPVFKLTNSDYLQFNQADYKGIALQFADMNADGSQDLILKYVEAGSIYGEVAFIPNTAAPGQPFNLSRANQVQLALDINADDYPFFYDLDGDGDLDVLIGTDSNFGTNTNSGAIHYYRQVGTNVTSFSSWQLVTHSFGQIPRIIGKYGLRPIIADLDQNNQPELITADDSGILNIYADVTTNLTGAFAGVNTILTSLVSGSNQSTRLGLNVHLAAADLDNDQKPDLVAGTNGGGVVYFKNNSQLLGIPEVPESINVSVYPNPAQNKVIITSKEALQVTIFDLAGRQLKTSEVRYSTRHELDVATLKPGIYYLKLNTTDYRSAGRKLVIQR